YVSNLTEARGFEENHFLWMATGQTEKMKRGIAPYTESSEVMGLARTYWSWDSRLEDFDNDGVLEAAQACGFFNAGTTDRMPELQEAGMMNDGLLKYPQWWPKFEHGDFIAGNTANALFKRSPSGRYFNIAKEVGFDQTQNTRAIATADVDGDGDMD